MFEYVNFGVSHVATRYSFGATAVWANVRGFDTQLNIFLGIHVIFVISPESELYEIW